MIVFAGLALLICLAVAIGTVDRRARESAWRRIATARRDNHRQLQTLRRCLESPRCAHCPINRLFGEW
jgi:hypothetical protein